MGRAEFQYDEVGNTFYYVLISFYAIVLLPSTYFFLPSFKEVEEQVDDRLCQCNGCVEKRKRKAAAQPYKKTKKLIASVALAVAWLVFALLVKKVSTIETTHVEYDPYTILELDQGAPTEAVKKSYRELSKKFHPDRGGDAVMFDRIAKAYQALTDEESKENWEKYGNPDGPTATTFGIALPKWLVSKEYGVWVLAFYGLVFMIILPVVVGLWWYNSIKYTTDKVLLDTTHLFGYFLRKTPKMEINRALMVLAGAYEFNKEYNSDIVLRETDDRTLPPLMKQLPWLNENKKEGPLSFPYSLKARILIHAYLSRLQMDDEGLANDQRYYISRCYRLVEEMCSIAQQITCYTPTKIPLETMDNLIRLMPMLIQAQWARKSPLLQLPHIAEHSLGYIQRQKVFTCADIAKLDAEKRRTVLNSLSDKEYRDVLQVLTAMPRLAIETSFEVTGEDDKHEVTAGCFVTLRVRLTRRSLLDPELIGDEALRLRNDEETTDEERDKLEDERDAEAEVEKEDTKPKRKVWEKQPQKKKGGKAKKGPKGAAKKQVAPNASPMTDDKKTKEEEKEAEEEKEEEKDNNSSDEGAGPAAVSGAEGDARDSEDEDDWVAEPKNAVLEGISYETNPVHCPYYPSDKFEWWWLQLTIIDKKDKKTQSKRIISPLVACKTLIDTQTVEMRFMAPEQRGVYTLNLAVHSDSYMDCDYSLDIKMEVKEAKEIVLPKYEDTEEEEDVAHSSTEEYTSESDDDA